MKHIVFFIVSLVMSINISARSFSERQLHLAAHVKVENTCPGSEPNEWLELVSDEEYDALGDAHI